MAGNGETHQRQKAGGGEEHGMGIAACGGG
jgi:hypothetical protein